MKAHGLVAELVDARQHRDRNSAAPRGGHEGSNPSQPSLLLHRCEQ